MKKLRKVWVLALLAAGFAMAFGGCSNGSSGSGSGNGGGSTDGSGDGTGTGTGDQTVSGIVTVFDPATYTGEVGKVVNGPDGEKYLEITPKSDYSTSIAITEIDLMGKTVVKCKLYSDKEDDTIQASVKLSNEAKQGFAILQLQKMPTTPKDASADILKEAERWDDEQKKNVKENVTDFKCVSISPYTQLMDGNWPAQDDITIYIGKITAE